MYKKKPPLILEAFAFRYVSFAPLREKLLHRKAGTTTTGTAGIRVLKGKAPVI
jgi:hypothetical protein